MVAIVTTIQVVSTWVSVVMVFIAIAAGIWLGHKARSLITGLALDAVQVWAAWQQAKLDTKRNQARLDLYINEGRLLMRDQRRQILADLEGGSL